MKIVNFNDVKNEIIQNFRRKTLIPCIGSGFSYQCPAFRGTVPSGKSYKQHMIKQLFDENIIPENERESFTSESFSEVSDIYQKNIDLSVRKKYLIDNFTHVQLSDNKIRFLNLPWPYIYTLNIDDAIEKNASYNIVYSNRPVDDSVFENCRCVIKLHGDVTEIVSYADTKSEVFAQNQYVGSISSNQQLLTRLSHDSEVNNLIFIGCSLDDEIDLSVYLKSSGEFSNSRYYVTCEKPSFVQQNKLQNYGITHIILFSDYDEIYQALYDAGSEAQKISVDDMEDMSSLTEIKLNNDFTNNKPYLFHGKGLIEKRKKELVIPYFLIQRDRMEKVLKQIDDYPLQIIAGRSFSGKTYSISELSRRIKNRTIYFFSSKERLTYDAFKSLMEKNNSVIFVDSNVLSRNQMELIFMNLYNLHRSNIRFIVAANYKDNDIFDIKKLYTIQEKIKEGNVPVISLKNSFSDKELNTLNPLLASIGVGIYSSDSIADNVIKAAKRNSEKHIFQNTGLNFNDYKHVAALILLATKKKVYSREAAMFRLLPELEAQCKKATPLIDIEEPFSYEINARDNSPKKYVVYANQWLLNQLSQYAENDSNHETIISAYKYIVQQIIVYYGNVDVLNSKKVSAYKDFILFDNINLLFYSERNAHKHGLELIRKIYESLNELLSLDPHYMHQRAKCYIKTSMYMHSCKEKIEYLEKAGRDINVAKQVFEERNKTANNQKILISIAHLTYTQALIMCHMCRIHNYTNKDENTETLFLLYDALCSEYNSYEYARNDSFNYGNAIGLMVQKITEDKAAFHTNAYKYMGSLIKATTKF